MRKIISVTLAPLIILLIISSIQSTSPNIAYAIANHVVISEIQAAGSTTTDEFVELYNPTTNEMDLSGWKVMRKTQSIDAEEQLIATLSGTIQPHGFMLIAHENYDDTTTPDITYTDQNIADNNSIILRDENNNTIDLVGFGEASTREEVTVSLPISNRSIERKAHDTSTSESMAPSGTDNNLGNGEDTDNNANDFVRHSSPTLSNPQNTNSTPENPESSTPTNPTETPTPTTSPTMTIVPTTTSQPTSTPTSTPTITPTENPSPTSTPSVTPPSPTPINPYTMKRFLGFFPFSRTVCYLEYTQHYFFFFPKITCERI